MPTAAAAVPEQIDLSAGLKSAPPPSLTGSNNAVTNGIDLSAGLKPAPEPPSLSERIDQWISPGEVHNVGTWSELRDKLNNHPVQAADEVARTALDAAKEFVKGRLRSTKSFAEHPVDTMTGLGQLAVDAANLPAILTVKPEDRSPEMNATMQRLIDQKNAIKQGLKTNPAGTVGELRGPVGIEPAAELAGKGVGAVARGLRDARDTSLKAIAKTTLGINVGESRSMAKDLGENNQVAIDQAAEDTAAQAAKHEQDVVDINRTNENARTAAVGNAEFAHQNDVQSTEAANQAATEAHQSKVSSVHQANADATTQYLQDRMMAEQHNQALQQTAEMRNQTVAQLADKTRSYFDKEAEVKARVKGENDENWQAWRDKVGDREVDMEPVREVIDRATTKFPEVNQILRETSLAPEEGSPAMDKFEKERSNIMEQQGYGTDYQSLSPVKQSMVDDLMDKLGMMADSGEEFDPEATAPMSISKLHDLKTQIGWKLFRNEYPPNVKRAMGQVFSALQRAESQTSIEAGALDDLLKARDSHAAYQEAFGRTKPTRLTQGDLRKKAANPEAFKADQDERRMRAVAFHEPSMVDDFNEVKKLRARMKTFPNDDALQRQMKQVPAAPEMKPLPEPPTMQEPSPLVVKIPNTQPVPPAPELVQPKLQLATPEAIESAKASEVENRIRGMRKVSPYRLGGLMLAGSSLVGSLAAMMFTKSIAPLITAGSSALMATGLAFGPPLMAHLLETNPEFVKAITKPTIKDLQEFMKLPKEQRPAIQASIQNMLDEAKRLGKMPAAKSKWEDFFKIAAAAGKATGVQSVDRTQQQQEQSQQSSPQPQQ